MVKAPIINTGWLAGLERSKDELQNLAKSTEGDFMKIADKLLDFHGRAGEMTDMASSAADSLSGAEISNAIDELRNLLDKSCSCLDQSCVVFNHLEDKLRHIINMLERLGSTFNDLEKMTKKLKIFSTNIKILSSDLGGKGEVFRVLAAEVNNLAQSIEKRSKAILSNSVSLTDNLRQTHLNLEKIKARQGELRWIISEGAVNALSVLKEKHDIASEAAIRISMLSNKTFQDIDNILVSLQFHDITRQQIEHVVDAFNEVRKKGDQLPPSDEVSDIPATVKNVFAIQAGQLGHARDELAAAVEGIMSSLEDILKNISQMVVQTGRMVGTAANKNSSFLIEIKESVNSITESLLNSLSECADMDKGLSSTVETVTGAVTEINSFIGDTEEIGTEIELLSLNARIKSAHIKEEGVGLGVVAEAIQTLSDDIRLKIFSVSETIKELVATAGDFGSGINEAAKKRSSEAEQMADELKRLNNLLTDMNSNISSRLDRLNPLADGLAKEIEGVISNTKVHWVAASVLEKVMWDLDYMAGSTTEIEEIGDKELQQRIESRYTMKAERDIHKHHVKEETFKHPERDKEGEVKYF